MRRKKHTVDFCDLVNINPETDDAIGVNKVPRVKWDKPSIIDSSNIPSRQAVINTPGLKHLD